jgi:energy-coupling factor transport system permease protein
MTSDKVVFLFGRVAPRLSLVLSMALGLIPKLKKDYKKISAAQKALGMYTSNSLTDRILGRLRALSALMGLTLESGIERADSMAARGYGLRGRTSYAIYSWNRRDIGVLALISAVFGVLIAGLTLGERVNFYPAFSGFSFSLGDILAYASIAVLGLFMGILEIGESIKWRLLVSKI